MYVLGNSEANDLQSGVKLSRVRDVLAIFSVPLARRCTS
jgi:hypothetical protein